MRNPADSVLRQASRAAASTRIPRDIMAEWTERSQLGFFFFFCFAKCETKAGVSGSGLTGGGIRHLVRAVVTPPPPVCVFLFPRSNSVALSHTLCVCVFCFFFPFVFLLRTRERERSSVCNRLLAHQLHPQRSPYRSPYRFHGLAGLFLIIYNIIQWETRFCPTGDEDDARAKASG